MRAVFIVWLWRSCLVCAFVSLPSMNEETAVLVTAAAVLSIYVECNKKKLSQEIKRLNDKIYE